MPARSAGPNAGRRSTVAGARSPPGSGMRPRTELALALGIVLVLGIIVTAVGGRNVRPGDDDTRRSTYLTGPLGARGFAEPPQRLGAAGERHRPRTTHLAAAGR